MPDAIPFPKPAEAAQRIRTGVEDLTAQVNLAISPEARRKIRLEFNPSGNPDVIALKVMTGGLISLLMNIRDDNALLECGDEIRRAIDHVQTASMLAVMRLTGDKAEGPVAAND